MNSFYLYELQIGGIDLYHILSWFFIYSLLGWIWESCYVSVKRKKWVNRGFVSGPCLTIYGFGAISVYMLLKSLPKNMIVLYIGGVIVATVLEYITALVMEAMFHTSWWDYSDKKFNFQGRICLGSSLFWGVMTVLLFYVLQPFVVQVSDFLPAIVSETILSVVIILYTVDFIFAFSAASNLAEKIHGINAIFEEWSLLLKESKLYESADEWKNRTAHLRQTMSDKKMELLLQVKEKEIMQRWDDTHGGENDYSMRQEFQKKYQEFLAKYMDARKSYKRITKRFINAYPGLDKLTKKRKEEERKKQNRTYD